QRKRRGVALRGIDRQADADRTRDARRADAQRQDVVVGLQLAGAGEERIDAIDVAAQRGHTWAELHHDAELFAADSREVLDEASGVAGRVTDVAARAGDLPLHRREDRIELCEPPR